MTEDLGRLKPGLQRKTLRVQMLGGPGVGKSSFVGALALLAQNPVGGYFLTPLDAATKRRFESVRRSLHRGHWPEKTHVAEPIRFRLHRRGETLDVELDDFAGEAFLAAMQLGDEDAASLHVESSVAEADLLLVMVDAGRLDTPDSATTMPLIQALSQSPTLSPEAARPSVGPPVAVVITKADLCTPQPPNHAAAVKQLVVRRLPKLGNFLESRLDSIAWLAISVCGYSSNGRAAADAGLPAESPDRFEPAGFEPLFALWFSRVRPPRSRRWSLAVAAVLTALVVVIAAWRYRDVEVVAQARLIEDPAVRLRDLPHSVAAPNEPAYRERVRDAIFAASQEIDEAGSEAEIGRVTSRFDNLPAAARRLAAPELESLSRRAETRLEQLLAARIEDARTGNDAEALREAVEQYLRRFPGGPHAQAARESIADADDRRRMRDREQIRQIVVRDAASLERKLDRIEDYLTRWPTTPGPQEREAIRLAVGACRAMLSPRRYDITLVRTAGLDRARAHGVRVKVAGETVALFDDSGTVSERTWNRPFTVEWQLNRPIDLTLLNYRFRNSDIAYFERRDPMAILLLCEKTTATRYGESFLTTRPPVTITMRCEQLNSPTVEAIRRWVYPGDSW